MMSYVVISTTTSSREEAKKIAASLLSLNLCACVQLMPIESYYQWKGKVENSEEILLLIKTKKKRYDKVEKEILKLSSYETPEILCSNISDGFSKYIKWMDEEIK